VRKPLGLSCPRCKAPVIVVDWAAVVDVVRENGEAAPAWALTMLDMPVSVVGPAIRKVLSGGSAGESWCCASCAVVQSN
jgi:hypothetical protein